MVPTMLEMAKGRAAGGEEADRVRAEVRHLRDKRFKGSQVDTAKALGVTAPTLSDLLSGKRGPGMQVLEDLRRLTGKSLDELVYGNRPSATYDLKGMGKTGATSSASSAASQLTGWAEAEAAARGRYPEVPHWAWEAARDVEPPAGADATVDLAADLAFVAWRHTGDDARRRYEAAALAKAGERLRAAPRAKD